MNLFIFGLGFSAGYFAKQRMARNDHVSGTVRSQDKAATLYTAGLTAHVFGPNARDSAIDADLAKADALLISVPPGIGGDPVLAAYAHHIAHAPNLRWIGYLSTIGVYGDHGGAWIDEQTLNLEVFITDTYLGGLRISFAFKGEEISILMTKQAEWFLDEYSGFAGGKRL